ncbi:hypothetical protein NC653_040881 [Populus alba x Populus x berolinensis]|uniref:Uncharacterized protein n=1 Tax=Populus alba x Populus x berolinensis TaxID=444605 RepID=A0AAD6L754_9ROSI|nr:hypothetical protein NC653_040881 [Populus alba x Populus x berolinensis]
MGCVEVVGCLKCEELASWEAVPDGVRLEGQTDFCWLCEQPQKLLVPFEMRGYQGVYNLERKIHEAAIRGLVPVKGPMPVKFPLPNPQDPFSLEPGSHNSNGNLFLLVGIHHLSWDDTITNQLHAPKNSPIIRPLPKPPFIPIPKSPPPPPRPPPPKVNDGRHPSLPPPPKILPPPHTYSSPRYPPPPQRS